VRGEGERERGVSEGEGMGGEGGSEAGRRADPCLYWDVMSVAASSGVGETLSVTCSLRGKRSHTLTGRRPEQSLCCYNHPGHSRQTATPI